MENGALDVWDAAKFRTSSSNALIGRTTKHTAEIKSVGFSRGDQLRLASAGVKGELYVYDVDSMADAYRLGGTTARADDIECLDWNYKPHNILATGSSGGSIIVWDVKAKRDMLTMATLGRRPVSAVCWDPNVSTRLITATSNDQDPLILVWDLRKAAEPERTLRGHELGVLGLDWCQQDSNLLLSCGKDNRTLCWDPNTGAQRGQFSVVTNWTFQTQWSPSNPDFFATASFDGKITVQSIQITNSTNQDPTTMQSASDPDDFFSQTRKMPQSTDFTLPDAPAWKKPSVGAVFGYGGKLVRFSFDKTKSASRLVVDDCHVQGDLAAKAELFQTTLDSGDLSSLCQDRIDNASTDEAKSDWKLMQSLTHDKPQETIRDSFALHKPSDKTETSPKQALSDEDDEEGFLAALAASNPAKPTTPFTIHPTTQSEHDKKITSALVHGDFMQAIEICFEQDRPADAMVIATSGGPDCVKRAQHLYFEKHSQEHSYMRVLSAISENDLSDVVRNADLANWQEIMITICSFASKDEFSSLCESLGDRLHESGAPRKDVSFCYLAGANLHKVVKLWIDEAREQEQGELKAADGLSNDSVHVKRLQELIEKVTIFRKIINYKDSQDPSSSPAIAPLYARYVEYADALAAQGQLSMAAKYLSFLPKETSDTEAVQQRATRAMHRPAQRNGSVAAARQPNHSSNNSSSFIPAASMPSRGPAPAAARAYMPAAQSTATQPYDSGPAQTYQPLMNGQPSTSSIFVGQNQQQPTSMQQPPAPLAPPPRTGETLSKPQPTGDWNDMPDNFFQNSKPPRRNTPSVPPTAAPLGILSPSNIKPAVLPPPPKAGTYTKPSTPAPSEQIAPPPSATSTSAYTPSQAQMPMQPGQGAYGPPNNYTNGYSQAPPQQPSTGSTPAYGMPPPTNTYAPTNSYQSQAAANGPSQPSAGPPPSGRYAPAPGATQQYAARPPSAGPAPYSASQGLPQGPPQGPPQRGPFAPNPTPPPMPGSTNQAHAYSGAPQGPPQGQPATLPPPPRGPPSIQRSSAPSATSAATDGASDQDNNDIQSTLSAEMSIIAAEAPPAFQRNVDDMRKRLDILYGHLQARDLLKPDTVRELSDICRCIQARDWVKSKELMEIMLKEKQESEGTHWMVCCSCLRSR